METDKLGMIYESKKSLEAVHQQIVACVNSTTNTLSGSSFELLERNVEESKATAACLSEVEDIFAAGLPSAPKAQVFQSSLSQSALQQDLLAKMCISGSKGSNVASAQAWLSGTAAERRQRLTAKKAELQDIQQHKSEATAAQKYLEASRLKLLGDSIRSEVEQTMQQMQLFDKRRSNVVKAESTDVATGVPETTSPTSRQEHTSVEPEGPTQVSAGRGQGPSRRDLQPKPTSEKERSGDTSILGFFF